MRALLAAFLNVWYRAPLWLVFTELGVQVEIMRACIQLRLPKVQP